MPYLSLSLLGPFQAWTANGVAQPFRTLKERALLAYLTVENEKMHRREMLADFFWPDRPEGIARNNLRQALYGIRHGIGDSGFDSIFTINTDDVQVNLGDQIWLDLAAFEIHLKSSQLHYHDQPGLCSYCIQNLRDGVEIYRGRFLEDVVLKNNPEFQKWVNYRRDQYMSLVTQSLSSLVSEYERIGDDVQAAIYARRQVMLEDVNEGNYRRLMTLLAKTGRISSALEEYENFRRRLKETRGTEPDQKTVLLAEKIRGRRFDTGSLTPRVVTHNLPEQLTPFIGREMELTKITNALQNPSCRLISLAGLGGVGKTRLAVQAAQISLRLFRDGVYFLALNSTRSSTDLDELIGQALGLVPGANKDMFRMVVDYLRSRQILFILDGFERYLECKDHLLDILKEAPYIKLLLTTRERLRFQAEYLVELNGLSFPSEAVPEEGEVNGENLLRFDAVRLLLERASRVYPGNSDIGSPRLTSIGNGRSLPDEREELLRILKNPKEMEAVLRICQLADGLPLGIELAASWTHDYSFAQIADEVQQNLEFLQNTLQDLPERHRSLRASFEHSWDLLSESEREVFSKLSVFSGSFSWTAAQEVAGGAQPWLVRLGDKSLVKRVAFGRYMLHPLLRQFAGQKLRLYSRRVEDQAHQQHAQFFCSLLKEREKDLKGFRQSEGLIELETDVENIFAAWDWAVEHHATELIEWATLGMLFFLEIRGRWQEGEVRFRNALNSLRDLDTYHPVKRNLALLNAGLGWFCCRLTRFQEAEELLQDSLQWMDGEEIPFGRIFAHFALGFLYTWMSRFQEAWMHLSTSLSLSEQGGDGWGLAWSRELLAEMAFESGRTGFDEKPFLSTLSLFERAGEQRGSCRALNYLGNIALAQERYPDALAYFEKLLSMAEKIGDVWGMAGGYDKLGQLASARGDYDQAWRLLRRSLAMLQKMGDQRRTAYVMRGLGEVAAALNKRAETAGYFQQALEIAARLQNLSIAQDVLTGIAAVMFDGQEKEKAADLLALVLNEPIGDKLTANRANRLQERMQAILPADRMEQARVRANQKALWQAVDPILLEGIKL